MPKGSFGGGRSSSRSSSRSSFGSRSLFSSKPQSSYSYSSPKSPVSAPSTAPTSIPTQHHSVKVEQPGFFSNVFQGFGLGAGQSMAFNLFRSTPSTTPVVTPTSTTNSIASEQFPKEYIQCMKEYNNNSDACKQYLEKDYSKQLY